MSQDSAQQIGERLHERLDFMQLGDEARRSLRATRPMIEKYLPGALDRFYDAVLKNPQVARLFSAKA